MESQPSHSPSEHEVAGPARPTELPPRPRRVQARGLETQTRLLAVAEERFARCGYDGTSIGDVAKAAGVGIGTVYHHFPDKRALLLAVIDAWAARRAAQDGPGSDALSRFFRDGVRAGFERWLGSAYKRLRAQPSPYLLVLGMAGRDPEVAERHRAIEERTAAGLQKLFESGVAAGQLRPDLDCPAAAVLVSHAIDVAATRLLVRGLDDPKPERVVAELAEMISRYVSPAGKPRG